MDRVEFFDAFARCILNTPPPPLVGKLEIFLLRYGLTIYPSFKSGGGTADHLTGSLLSNLMILETMLSSDFFSDLYFSRYKFFGVN